ncbi:MAG: hypothetical protein R3B49_03395 [Phycisphaerales bacterium]
MDVDDFDDIDDFDGITFSDVGTPGLDDGDLPGPIDAFGNVIPEITVDGDPMVSGSTVTQAMTGWSQTVIVEKLEPFDTSTVVPDWEDRSASGGPAVDEFPLRVSVEVRYQGARTTSSRSW